MNNADMPTSGVNGILAGKAVTVGEMKEVIKMSGLTKREHFAGLAMQGFAASDVGNDLQHSDIGILKLAFFALLIES